MLPTVPAQLRLRSLEQATDCDEQKNGVGLHDLLCFWLTHVVIYLRWTKKTKNSHWCLLCHSRSLSLSLSLWFSVDFTRSDFGEEWRRIIYAAANYHGIYIRSLRNGQLEAIAWLGGCLLVYKNIKIKLLAKNWAQRDPQRGQNDLKVLPGLEPGSWDSESQVLTITP